MTPQEMVKEFHDTFCPWQTNEEPTLVDDGMAALRLSLMEEELQELEQADNGEDLIGIADALADLAYVVYGTALCYGIDLDAVIAEVHRSNMSKLGADGKPVLRADGKVLKGPHYSPPDIPKVLKLDVTRA